MYSPHGLEPWKPLHDAGRVRIVIRTQVVQHARAHECVDARTVRWLDLDGRQLGVFLYGGSLHRESDVEPDIYLQSCLVTSTESQETATTPCGDGRKLVERD